MFFFVLFYFFILHNDHGMLKAPVPERSSKKLWNKRRGLFWDGSPFSNTSWNFYSLSNPNPVACIRNYWNWYIYFSSCVFVYLVFDTDNNSVTVGLRKFILVLKCLCFQKKVFISFEGFLPQNFETKDG